MNNDSRDRGWVDPHDTPATLREHVERLGHGDRMDVSIPYGTVRIERINHEFKMSVLGDGGGFCWSRQGPARRVVAYLTQWEDRENLDNIEVRHRDE